MDRPVKVKGQSLVAQPSPAEARRKSYDHHPITQSRLEVCLRLCAAAG